MIYCNEGSVQQRAQRDFPRVCLLLFVSWTSKLGCLTSGVFQVEWRSNCSSARPFGGFAPKPWVTSLAFHLVWGKVSLTGHFCVHSSPVFPPISPRALQDYRWSLCEYGLFVGSVDLSPGCQPCTVSTWPTEPSPQPQSLWTQGLSI